MSSLSLALLLPGGYFFTLSVILLIIAYLDRTRA